MPSVFEELILRPEIFLKISISSKSDFAESTSANVAVVSSAYCRTFVSSCPRTIPLISAFCRMVIASVSTASTKRYGDKGSSCRTPRSSGKKFDVKPIGIFAC